MIVSFYYVKKSFEKVGEVLNNGHFKTAGLLLFIGMILVVIFVGVFVLLVGQIFEIIAFFTLPDEIEALEQPVS